MARTRGGKSRVLENRENVERIRPTASACCRQCESPQQVHDDDIDEQQADVVPPLTTGEGYPGGPKDTSLLTQYVDHIVCSLWDGHDQGELKFVSHGRKLSKFTGPHNQISCYIENSGLSLLITCSYDTIDKTLLSTFFERWHKETSSFHLPMGEMIVTLDDVYSLLHIPITGKFVCYPDIDKHEAIPILIELLGVTNEEAVHEIMHMQGLDVCLQFLRDTYDRCVVQQQWVFAARAYLLHLVGCTIFADKSVTTVYVGYLALFRHLNQCDSYSWGAAALSQLYEHLAEACLTKTKQASGYAMLLQGWIFEHFLKVGSKEPVGTYIETAPRCARWGVSRVLSSITSYRRQLDEITLDAIDWTPYTTHREQMSLQLICLFSRYIRAGPYKHLHLLERVLRQFAYVQDIPRNPSEVFRSPLTTEHIDLTWIGHMDNLVKVTSAVVYPSDCVTGYMERFYTISHSYICPVQGGDPSRPQIRVTPVTVEGNTNTSQQQHPVVGVCQRIATTLQHLIDLKQVTEGTNAYEGVQVALNLARGVTTEGNVYVRSTHRATGHRRGNSQIGSCSGTCG